MEERKSRIDTYGGKAVVKGGCWNLLATISKL